MNITSTLRRLLIVVAMLGLLGSSGCIVHSHGYGGRSHHAVRSHKHRHRHCHWKGKRHHRRKVCHNHPHRHPHH